MTQHNDSCDGTHADFQRHRKAGEQPCDASRLARNAYARQRNYKIGKIKGHIYDQQYVDDLCARIRELEAENAAMKAALVTQLAPEMFA